MRNAYVLLMVAPLSNSAPPAVFKTVSVAFATFVVSEAALSGNDISFNFPGTIAACIHKTLGEHNGES